jgi:hypothetical protein
MKIAVKKLLLTCIKLYLCRGKRINSLTTELEQVKLNQKVADKEKGTYIQEQNIQINQGKMPVAEDCHTSVV